MTSEGTTTTGRSLADGWRLAFPDDPARWSTLTAWLVRALEQRGVEREQVVGELARAAEFMRRGTEQRQWFVVTSESMRYPVPVVLAVGWIRLVAGPPAGVTDAALAVSAEPSVLTLSSQVVDLGGAPALVRHDVITRGDGGMRERALVVGYHEPQGAQLHAEVSTSDMSAFHDLSGSLVAFLSHLKWEDA